MGTATALAACAALSACGGTTTTTDTVTAAAQIQTVTQTSTVTSTSTEQAVTDTVTDTTAAQQPAASFTDCVDRGDCPLTIARARVVLIALAAAVAKGSGNGDATYGVQNCNQQSPYSVTCDYYVNDKSAGVPTCHFVQTEEVTQPTYQRALQSKEIGTGSCQ